MSKNLLIIGAGGHGSVVADVAEATGRWSNIEFLDDRYPEIDHLLMWKVVGSPSLLDNYGDKQNTDVIVAIGNNKIRMALINKLLNDGFHVPAIIHPDAYISPLSTIGNGTVVIAKCVVNAGASIGTGCILNTGCTIGHGCEIGNGVHVSSGANIAGEVTIGDLTWIGIGSVVKQRIHIGSNVMVGAGTVIINDIPDNVTVVGVPGRIISREGATADGPE